MAKKRAKTTTTKSPRTVQQLVPWLNAQFGHVIGRLSGDPPQNHQPSALPSRTEAAAQVTGSLHQAIAALGVLLAERSAAASADSALPAELTRALLLSGNGERFDPAVRLVIRRYCQARREVFRYSRHSELPEDLRDDIIAAFTAVMEEHRLELQQLGVRIEEVEPAAQIDPGKHEVVKQLVTDEVQKLDTIRDCVTPIFRWTTGQGVAGIQQARVVAFTRLKEPQQPAATPSAPPAAPTDALPEASERTELA